MESREDAIRSEARSVLLQILNFTGQLKALTDTCSLILLALPLDVRENLRSLLLKELTVLEEEMPVLSDPTLRILKSGSATTFRNIIREISHDA